METPRACASRIRDFLTLTTGRQNAGTHRVLNKARDIPDAEAIHDLGSVGFYGLHADLEQARDLLRRVPLDDELQDLALTRRQLWARTIGRDAASTGRWLPRGLSAGGGSLIAQRPEATRLLDCLVGERPGLREGNAPRRATITKPSDHEMKSLVARGS